MHLDMYESARKAKCCNFALRAPYVSLQPLLIHNITLQINRSQVLILATRRISVFKTTKNYARFFLDVSNRFLKSFLLNDQCDYKVTVI
jgi:hypothetical protein